MSIFANKKIWKRIAIIIGIIAFIGVVFPMPSSAGIGGVLMTGIMDLFIGIADGIQTIIHKVFYHQDTVIYLIVAGGGFNWFAIATAVLGGLALLGLGLSLSWVFAIGIGIVLTLSLFGQQQIVINGAKTITLDMLNDDSISLPTHRLTPYEIFTDEDGLFSVDFFTKKDNESSGNDHIISLNKNISDWYATLRLIAIVGMMSVLVYMGIRILLSSTAESAAKYKKMMWDWLVATFLIFTMQYIMVFANFMVNSLVDTIGTLKTKIEVINKETNETIATHVNKEGVEGYLIGAKIDNDSLVIDSDTTDLVKQAYKQLVSDDQNNSQDNYKSYFYKDESLTVAESENDAKILFWPAYNYTTQSRLNAQFVRNENGADVADYIGYGLIYVALSIYTAMFIFVYIKRYIYMVFLTLISPLVALTYPIDKVKDGQAQAFNFWFREYLYNLLLQPLHLILYMLLIGSAMRFASNNPVYVIVCLGFMLPAEKLLKAMFGFKGQTPGSMPGIATAALIMTGTRKLFGGGPKGGGTGSNNGSNSGDDDSGSQPIRTLARDFFLGDDGSGGSSGGSSGGDSGGGSGGDSGGGSGGDSGGGSGDDSGGDSGSDSENDSGDDSGSDSGSDSGGSSGGGSSGSRKRIARIIGRKVGKWTLNTTKSTIRTASKFGAGVAIGAVGATAGGIAGMISGDPSKAFEYATAGGAAGYAVGSRGGAKVGEGILSLGKGAADVIDDYNYNKDPDKYKEKHNQRYTDDYIQDKDKMRILKRNRYDDNQYKDLVEKHLGEYHKAGYTDPKEIAAMEKYRMKYAKNKRSIQEAINMQKTHEAFYKGVSGSGENSSKFKASLAEKIQKKNPTYSQQQINTAIQNTINMMKTYDDLKSGIN